MTTDSSAVAATEAGLVTDFLEALALVEAVVTLFGTTYLVGGVRDTRAAAVGVVHRVVAALGVLAHIMGHGDRPEAAVAVHGAHPEEAAMAAMGATLLEVASVEDSVVALAAPVWVAPEATLTAVQEVCLSAEVLQALCQAAYPALVLAHSV